MTYVTDPIGDFLTRMRNAQAVGKASCTAPYSRLKHQLADVMVAEEWLTSVSIEGEEPKRSLRVEFNSEKSPLTLKRVSTPGRRVYQSYTDLKPVLQGFGTAVLTTSAGLMTDKQAKDKKLGGELLCTIS